MALESGALVLPDAGQIAVYRPRAGDVLSDLPTARVVVLTGFKPDHDHFAAKGYATGLVGPAAMAIVCVPRAKAEARALLAAAAADLAPGGVIVIDGQKTDGVDSILKDCKGLGLAVGAALAKAHGKLAVVVPGPALADWAAQVKIVAGGFQTLPGVFSADGADRGSALLAAALPGKLPARVADLGAGWGYLSQAVLAREGVQELDVIEAEAVALDCARINLNDSRAVFHWADALTFKPARPWQAVVMNPPFHTSRDADPGLGMGFIRAAHRGLGPGGVLWLVANKHLPYDPLLATLFRDVETIGGDAAFRLTRAAHPIKPR
jgi:16S rRNA (guanine1207-N2)-methyltransferase